MSGSYLLEVRDRSNRLIESAIIPAGSSRYAVLAEGLIVSVTYIPPSTADDDPAARPAQG